MATLLLLLPLLLSPTNCPPALVNPIGRCLDIDKQMAYLNAVNFERWTSDLEWGGRRKGLHRQKKKRRSCFDLGNKIYIYDLSWFRGPNALTYHHHHPPIFSGQTDWRAYMLLLLPRALIYDSLSNSIIVRRIFIAAIFTRPGVRERTCKHVSSAICCLPRIIDWRET